MNTAYKSLTERFQRLSRINHAISYLNWDQMVMMPPKGVTSRAEAIAELAGLYHETLTAPEVGDLIAEAGQGLSPDDELGLREMTRVWQQETCLPAELVKAKIVAGSRCEHGWRTQRETDDWDGFYKNFIEVVELGREEATLRQQHNERFATPYDALLDLHCTGDSKELIDTVFGELRAVLPGLLVEVVEKQLRAGKRQGGEGGAGVYDLAEQKRLNEKLMGVLGFDFESGRLDISMHPFSMGGAGDLRITTRFRDTEFLDALMATAHETGHASYEGGLPEKWADVPVGQHRNMCIHESQSLMFEKQIFLSRSFMSFFASEIQASFPDNGANADQLWTMATQVEPGFIRVEADEVTYPLHVLLRYEIESSLINGEIEAKDIPELWNTKMKEYLGLDVGKKHSIGCMQDIHWTDGAFGYFPSYTLGAVNASQIFKSLKNDHSDWEDRFAKGDITFVRDWLQEKIWSRASFASSQQLVKETTGSGTSAEFYIEHLKARYLEELY